MEQFYKRVSAVTDDRDSEYSRQQVRVTQQFARDKMRDTTDDEEDTTDAEDDDDDTQSNNASNTDTTGVIGTRKTERGGHVDKGGESFEKYVTASDLDKSKNRKKSVGGNNEAADNGSVVAGDMMTLSAMSTTSDASGVDQLSDLPCDIIAETAGGNDTIASSNRKIIVMDPALSQDLLLRDQINSRVINNKGDMIVSDSPDGTTSSSSSHDFLSWKELTRSLTDCQLLADEARQTAVVNKANVFASSILDTGDGDANLNIRNDICKDTATSLFWEREDDLTPKNKVFVCKGAMGAAALQYKKRLLEGEFGTTLVDPNANICDDLQEINRTVNESAKDELNNETAQEDSNGNSAEVHSSLSVSGNTNEILASRIVGPSMSSESGNTDQNSIPITDNKNERHNNDENITYFAPVAIMKNNESNKLASSISVTSADSAVATMQVLYHVAFVIELCPLSYHEAFEHFSISILCSH